MSRTASGRALALGASLVAVMTLAAPASAHHYASLYHTTWGPALTGSGPVSGLVVFKGGTDFGGLLVKVQRVKVEVSSSTGVTWTLCDETYTAAQSSATIDLGWDTTSVPGAGLARCGSGATVPTASGPQANGTYTLHATAWDSLAGSDAHEQTKDVIVSNRPSPPVRVSASFDPTSQVFDVAWRANPEPDITGYAVERCITSTASSPCSEWARAGRVGASAVQASVAPSGPGTYRFRVEATRASGAPGGADLVSDASDPSGPVVLDAGNGSSGDPGTGGRGGAGGGGTESPRGSAPATSPSTAAPPAAPERVPVVTPSNQQAAAALPKRLIERTVLDDPGFQERLPYVEAQHETAGPLGALADQRGHRNVLVPAAAGLLLFVFAMQMRHLNRRAGAGSTPSVAAGFEG